MKTYHGKQAVKDLYIRRIKEHQKMDNIIQGTYWLHGRGCAVGCTIESRHEPHENYPDELGLPTWLAHLEDSIFESLPIEDARKFPLEFLESIPVGVEVPDSMNDRFYVFWLERQQSQINVEVHAELNAVIDTALHLHKQVISGEEIDTYEWDKVLKSSKSIAWSIIDETLIPTPGSLGDQEAAYAAARAVEASLMPNEAHPVSEFSASRSAARCKADVALRLAPINTEESNHVKDEDGLTPLELWAEEERKYADVETVESRVTRDWILTELKLLK